MKICPGSTACCHFTLGILVTTINSFNEQQRTMQNHNVIYIYQSININNSNITEIAVGKNSK